MMGIVISELLPAAGPFSQSYIRFVPSNSWGAIRAVGCAKMWLNSLPLFASSFLIRYAISIPAHDR